MKQYHHHVENTFETNQSLSVPDIFNGTGSKDLLSLDVNARVRKHRLAIQTHHSAL